MTKQTPNNSGPVVSEFGLDAVGLTGYGEAFWNLSPTELTERAVANGEAKLAKGGVINAVTGKYTGRSPNDKFVVRQDGFTEGVNWGKVNQEFSDEAFEALHKRMMEHLSGATLFVQDLYCGADPESRMKVRVVTEQAWHNLFASNMFIRPAMEDRASHSPDFTVIQVPSFKAEPKRDGTNSEVAVVVNYKRGIILVCGSAYAGEIKKSIFSVMNHRLPAVGILPMHCSANVDNNAEGGPRSAVFFGLSGTGKTTLSADSTRTLIGDDEHGWSNNGIFNFEGGCYAKTINLRRDKEPEIYDTCSRFGSVLENVGMDPHSRELDFDDDSLTQNTRVCYPIDFIPNASETGMAAHPSSVVMLTADAFGVLPPISRLTAAQAMYHFLSGYTAKLAGTEIGLKGAQATFSTCFGAPFMTRHPRVYAELLGQRLEAFGSTAWLVNTGWSGGGVGTGSRMDIAYTRRMVNAAINGELDDATFEAEPFFGLQIPTEIKGVPSEVLNPRNTWDDKAAYDAAAADLAQKFVENFKQFADDVGNDVLEVAIAA